MSRTIFINLLASTLLLFNTTSWANEVSTILKAADKFRLPAESVRVESLVKLYKNDQLTKERRYSVYIKPDRRSLVIFRSNADLGQKVLMLADKFYLLMPRSKRPIRITPMQRLLGEASTGDIATMTWHAHYQGKVVARDIDIDGTRALHLSLRSEHSGTTYSAVELYVAAADYRPLQADLYLSSGKLAKQARYTLGMRNGDARIVSMILRDNIQKGQRTEIHYTDITPIELADKFYNPAYLVRNNVPE